MKWSRRLKLMQFSKVAIIVCLIMTIILAGFTVYGEKVGSFVIDTEEDKPGINIALSDKEDMSDQTDRLAIKGLSNQRDTTLENIPVDIAKGIGSKTDVNFRRYIAHSFYIINNSDMAVDLLMDMDITSIKLNVDSAVRIMLIVGDDKTGVIYAKWQENVDSQGRYTDKIVNGNRIPEIDPSGETRMFAGDGKIFSETMTNLQANDAVKITLLVWLEGWDPQCTDELYGGAIKLAMNIKAF